MEFKYLSIQVPSGMGFEVPEKTIPLDVIAELHSHLSTFDEDTFHRAGSLMDALWSFRYTRDGVKDQRLLLHHLEPIFRYVIWNGLWTQS